MKSNLTFALLAAGYLAAATTLLAQPVLQFNPVAFTTSENAGTVSLTVQRTGAINSPASVNYATADGTATAGVKYTATNGTVAFAAGATRQTISIPLLNDNLVGGTTTFRVLLSNPTNAVLGTGTIATVSIVDPDLGVSFRLATYSFAEDFGEAIIGIVRDDDGDQPMSVDLNTSDLTALEGRDYTGLHTKVVLPGDRRLTFVNISILNNQFKDGNRTFRATLSNPVDGTLGCTTVTTITLLDNDPGFEFESASYSVGEDGGSVLIGVRRGNDDTTMPVTVDYATSDVTALAGTDYVGTNGTLAFAAGETVKTIAVPVLNDGLKESTKTFRVTLNNPTAGAVLGVRTSTTVSIQDNDPGAGFEVASYSVWSGAGELTLTVVRGSDATLAPFSVEYATADGTAKAGEDYQATSGTLEFQTNETVLGLTIPILRHAGIGQARTFNVILSTSTNGPVLTRASVNVGIQENYAMMIPEFASGLTPQLEGGALTLRWSGGGSLQRADQPIGPWQTISTASSPYRVAPRLEASFYRVTHPRPASVYVPTSYDPATPMPLILLLHGAGDSGQGVENYMQFRPLAESRGFLYCYPDSTVIFGVPFWNADDFNCDPSADWGAPITDDAGYLRDLIEEIARRFALDRKRIYVIGRSAGGSMAYRMACQFADLVAGMVSHAGVSYYDSPWCVPSQPVNVLRLHSVEDGGFWGGSIGLCNGWIVNNLPVPSAVQTVQKWANYNEASNPATAPEPTLDLICDLPGPDTIVTRYQDHSPGGAVELWTLIGGPHRPCLTTNYSPAIIDWLLAHPKP